MGRFQMLFLENGQVSGFRTTLVGEGELGCGAASAARGGELFAVDPCEGPPIPRARELNRTSPISATAMTNAQRRLPMDATRSVGRMRAALDGGIRGTGGNYDVTFASLDAVLKGEPK